MDSAVGAEGERREVPTRVLLLSCYELGHQPLGLASAASHLLAVGAAVQCLDLAVEPFGEARVEAADFVGISVPMHTALRLGVAAARRGGRPKPPRPHLLFRPYPSPETGPPL